MSDKASLLPVNATLQERAVEQSTARIQDVPTPLRDLWNPDTCPVELMPWLAWALSLDFWKSYWPEPVKRLRLKEAIKIQRRKGTVRSIRDVASSFGAALSLKEWWQNDPPTTPYTFDVLLAVGGDVPATAEYQADIIDEITRTKPVRSHFTLTAGVKGAGGIGIQGTARPYIYSRISAVEQI